MESGWGHPIRSVLVFPKKNPVTRKTHLYVLTDSPPNTKKKRFGFGCAGFLKNQTTCILWRHGSGQFQSQHTRGPLEQSQSTTGQLLETKIRWSTILSEHG